MKDRDLQQQVLNALRWEPSVEASEIGVTVEEGVVTLHGVVWSYGEKETAELVAQRVYGVKGVANEIRVQLPSGSERTDTDIAQAAVQALSLSSLLPDEAIMVSVHDGWLTLKGTVNWRFQKDAAVRAVRDLAGVTGLTNAIEIQPRITADDVQAKIEEALKRSAEIEARRIKVSVHDGTVSLSGNVRSWGERQEAERAAWAAPGIKHVEDNLLVVP